MFLVELAVILLAAKLAGDLASRWGQPPVLGQLVAGLFAEGHVAPTSDPALIVPGAAVERTGDSAAVVRFTAGHIERRAVQTGEQDPDGNLVEIRTGLTLGDTVVLGVSRSLPTGTAARVAGTKSGVQAVTPIAR